MVDRVTVDGPGAVPPTLLGETTGADHLDDRRGEVGRDPKSLWDEADPPAVA